MKKFTLLPPGKRPLFWGACAALLLLLPWSFSRSGNDSTAKAANRFVSIFFNLLDRTAFSPATGPDIGRARPVTTILLPGNMSYLIPDCEGVTYEAGATLSTTTVPQVNLACIGVVNATLEEGCRRTLSASNVLTGTFGYLTNDDFEITVLDGDPSNGPVIDGCGEFPYEIRLRQGVDGGSFSACGGTVRSEDKTGPQLACPPNTNSATLTRPAQFIYGTLGPADPLLAPADQECFTAGGVPPGNPAAQHYDLYSFFVTAPAIYTFLMTDTFAGGASGFLALYQGQFMPGYSCENMIYRSDSSLAPNVTLSLSAPNGQAQVFNPGVRIALPLKVGETYTLLVGSASAVTALGAYSIAVYNSANGRLIAPGLNPPQATTLNALLLCNDIHQIFIDAPQTFLADRQGNVTAISPSLNRILGYTGFPEISDNCGPLKVTVSDQVYFNGNCGDAVITRTFRVADKQNSTCGGLPNTSECTQIITLRKPGIHDVSLPPLISFLGCQDAFPTLPGGDPSPSATGFPFVASAFGINPLNPGWCNLAAQYLDQPRTELCPGFYKFLRNWTVLDWCNPGNSRFHSQLMAVGNFLAPKVTCPVMSNPWGAAQHTLAYSTTPFDCTASFEAPLPSVNAPCAGSWTIHTEIATDVMVPLLDSLGQQTGTTTQTAILRTILPGSSRFVSGIPVGNHRFRFLVTDDCGNFSVEECPFQVIDIVEPNAICDDQIRVSLNGQGTARLTAADIDEGSNDNCGMAGISVRRRLHNDADCAPAAETFSDWADFVDFTCCDAGQSVRVELRVTDLEGNENICRLDVPVEDKIIPFCRAPQDRSVNCNELPYGFNPNSPSQLRALFGQATAEDNCSASAEELAPIVNLHPCGWGTIIRRFRAVDNSGNVSANQCRQIVTIDEVHNYEIRFPKDADGICGLPFPDTIHISEIACDLLAVSVHDESLRASERGCFKVLRTYRVINWCEYDGQSPPVIVGRDEDCDSNPGDERIWVLVRPGGMTYLDRDNDQANHDPPAFAKSADCDGYSNPAGYWMNSSQNPAIASRGFWQYTQHIKVFDNFGPSISVAQDPSFCSYDSPAAASAACGGAVSIPFSVEEKCTPNEVTVTVFLDAFRDGVYPFDHSVRRDPDGALSGDTNLYLVLGNHPLYRIESAGAPGLPIGLHRFEILAEDGCGNVESATVFFEVRDCKPPTPVCYNGLAAALMPADTDNDGVIDGGMATVWASDFIASPALDCTMPVGYSIRRAGQSPDSTRSALHFSCSDYNPADVTTGTLQIVYIDAWDGAGNRDFCETYIRIQDQSGICTGSTSWSSIAGVVRTEQQQPVQGVEMALSGPIFAATETSATGAYLFDNLSPGADYTVTPVLDRDYLNGVTTFDLVLIQRHILAVQPLDSPYKMIAADANNSRSITTADVILLRRLILALIDDLPNNTSWRFIPLSYDFPVPANPWFEAFPEVINANDATGALIARDFIGIKIGDVNGSAAPNAAAVEVRSAQGEFILQTEDQPFNAGDRMAVAFHGKDMERITGYQLSLEFNHEVLRLEGVEYGAARPENFGLRFAEQGLITMSWHEWGVSDRLKSGEVLFALVFQAHAPGRLRDLLKAGSAETRAEAYDRDGRILDVALHFDKRLHAGEFTLYQNQPNPFDDITRIAFYLPEAGEATLAVSDLQGRVLYVHRGDYATGLHHIQLRAGALPAGILQYTFSSGAFTATRRMVITR